MRGASLGLVMELGPWGVGSRLWSGRGRLVSQGRVETTAVALAERGGDTGRSVDTHIHINHLYHGTWDEPIIPFAFRPRWPKSLVVARSSLHVARWSSGRATCMHRPHPARSGCC